VWSFRANNPHLDLLVVDVPGTLPPKVRCQIRPHARIWTGRDLGTGIPWDQTCVDKLRILNHSPFAQTAMFDADVLWVGSAAGIFDGVTADFAGVSCPRYRQGQGSRAGYCAGVEVCTNRFAAARATLCHRRTRNPQSEEAALALAADDGYITRQLLPPEWGFEGRAWWNPGPGAMHDWQHPAVLLPSRGLHLWRWAVDGTEIRAFHFTGNKDKYLTDPRVRSYLGACREAIVR
jgi:hypothetical protein